MLYMRYLHNNTYKKLKPDGVALIGVYTRTKDVEFTNWLGTIERNHAIEISDKCIPVRLAIDSYSFHSEEFGIEWIELENGTFIQGCYVPALKGAFVVVEEGKPKLITQKYSMAGAHSGKY
jgi:hypothetical protein